MESRKHSTDFEEMNKPHGLFNHTHSYIVPATNASTNNYGSASPNHSFNFPSLYTSAALTPFSPQQRHHQFRSVQQPQLSPNPNAARPPLQPPPNNRPQ